MKKFEKLISTMILGTSDAFIAPRPSFISRAIASKAPTDGIEKQVNKIQSEEQARSSIITRTSTQLGYRDKRRWDLEEVLNNKKNNASSFGYESDMEPPNAPDSDSDMAIEGLYDEPSHDFSKLSIQELRDFFDPARKDEIRKANKSKNGYRSPIIEKLQVEGGDPSVLHGDKGEISDSDTSSKSKGFAERIGKFKSVKGKKEQADTEVVSDKNITVAAKTNGEISKKNSVGSVNSSVHNLGSSASLDKLRQSDPAMYEKGKQELNLLRGVYNNTSAVKAMYEDSSDSEDALDPYAKDYSQKKRRQAHKEAIEDIARQAFPPDDETQQLYKEAMQLRERDRQSKREYNFSKDTDLVYSKLGDRVKKTTIMHNPLFRKAYKKAIPDVEDALASNISEYEGRQGHIRKELLGVIQEDAIKMDWKKSEFDDPNVWKVVQFLKKNVMSGNGGEKIADVADERKSLGKNATPYVAWHHLAFKASRDVFGNNYVSVFSLRPDILMATHDTRHQKDGSVARKMLGDHQHLHWVTSTSKTNCFSKMEPYSAGKILSKTLVPKTTKREKYALDIFERLEDYVENNQSNVDAKMLFRTVDNMKKEEEPCDLNKYLKSQLKKHSWGKKLIKQQEQVDARSNVARLEASGKESSTLAR